MALSPLFPIYPDTPNGPYHVSLSIEPPFPSSISKSVGVTSSTALLIPNMDFLSKFTSGDIGIADSLIESSLAKNFASPIASRDERVFKKFSEINGIEIDDIDKYKKDGRFKMPKSEIKVPSTQELLGFKALEKSMIQSIFETQKPYIEIIKLVTANLGKIEDICARIMPLVAPQPLAAISEKPISNSGNTIRPKSLGLGGGDAFKLNLGKLSSVSTNKTTIKVNRDGSVSRKLTNPPSSGQNNSVSPVGPSASGLNYSTTETPPPGFTFSILSTVYSTGEFIPGVDYKFLYIDLPQEPGLSQAESDNIKLDDSGDPQIQYKPEKIILGIFDSKGSPLNPNEFLRTISGITPNGVVTYTNTPFKKADWILRSPKWALPSRLNDGRQSIYTWPTFGKPIYQWKKFGFVQSGVEKPGGDNWELDTYKEGDRNIISGEIAVPGSPKITGFSPSDEPAYREYFDFLVDYALFQSKDLTQEEKNSASTQVKSALNVRAHLENVILYGQAKSSVYEPVGGGEAFPENMRFPFKPYLYYSPLAATDANLRQFSESRGLDPGFIYIDPEADYDIKVIRVDPTTNIEYETGQNEPAVSVNITSFVKNKLTININREDIPFDIEIIRNGVSQTFENTTRYVLENWNYNSSPGLDPSKRFENNNYSVSIWSKIPTRRYKDITHTERISIDLGNLISNPLQNGDITVYRVDNIGGRRYYKRRVYRFNRKFFKILSLIGRFDSNRMLNIIKEIEDSNIKQWSLKFKVSDIFNSLNETYQYVNSGLGSLLRPITISFSLSGTNYQYSLRVDQMVKKLTDQLSGVSNDLLNTLLIRVRNFEFEYNFTLNEILVSNQDVPFPDGVINLEDQWGTRVFLQNDEITKWYFIYQKNLREYSNTNLDIFSLPPFGKDYQITLNYNSEPNSSSKDLSYTRNDLDIPLWNLKVANDEFPYGKVIDPSKVTNSRLANEVELFSQQKYGHGSDANPQRIDVIKRFMLTDTDTESYYIIEGVLIDKNPRPNGIPTTGQVPGGQGPSGSDYYTLPHALGATRPFISIMVDVATKITPQINSLLNLLKDPRSFVTEIISEKLSDGFEIFSPEALNTFKEASEIGKNPNLRKSERVNELDRYFKASKLKPIVFTNRNGDFNSIIDGPALIPFSMFGKDLSFGMELKFNYLKENKPPFKMILPSTTPASKSRNFQLYNSPLPTSNNPNLNQLANASNSGINLNDPKNQIPNDIKQRLENYEIVNIKYSTGEFIEGVNYNFYYIDLDVLNLVKESDELVQQDTPESLSLAKEKLEQATKLDPLNELVKLKLKDLLRRIRSFEISSQPLLKLILGIVTTPIKIIGGIIQWILDFFKSLTNPVTLPFKLAEFLSFGWFKQFFTPVGLLDIAGIKFKVEKLAQWVALVNIPNPVKTGGVPQIPPGLELPQDLVYNHPYPKGDYLIPDDYEIADLNLFLNVGFLPKLPTYTAKQIRDYPTNPLRLMSPVLCLFEKIINGIIDFFWSLIGIEAVIPPPHIRICKKIDGNTLSPEDLQKILSGQEPSGGTQSGGSGSGAGNNGQSANSQSQNAATEEFIYEIQLSDGRVIKGLNQEQLQAYIDENKDTEFDFFF